MISIGDQVGQLGESEASSDGKVKEWYVDIRSSKVIAPAWVDWGPFVVDPWTSTWLCTDRMLDFWGPVNRRSSMIVVVERHPTIPLETFTGIVYGPHKDSLVWGIAWKMCTRERCDPDWPYDIVAKACHSWPVRGHAYFMLVRFIPCMVYYWLRSPRHSLTHPQILNFRMWLKFTKF
jgi:hypothetical protein